MMSSSRARRLTAAASLLGVLVALRSSPADGQPPSKKPPPLEGSSYDYAYDGKADRHPERRWLARVFVHRRAAALAGQALPLLVFIHGNNAEKIKYRWMGGGQEGDVRRIVSEMIETGMVPPMLVAAPSSIDPSTMSSAGLTWPAFDLDLFVEKTIARLGSAAVVDRRRVMVAGHSGAGCNIRGGLASALRAKGTPVLAAFSIDTCMLLDLARDLAHVRPTTHVIVTWQSMSWSNRAFGAFRAGFLDEVKKAPPAAGVLREFYFQQTPVPLAHDAMVGITLRRYLPRLLGPGTPDVVKADAGADGG